MNQSNQIKITTMNPIVSTHSRFCVSHLVSVQAPNSLRLCAQRVRAFMYWKRYYERWILRLSTYSHRPTEWCRCIYATLVAFRFIYIRKLTHTRTHRQRTRCLLDSINKRMANTVWALMCAFGLIPAATNTRRQRVCVFVYKMLEYEISGSKLIVLCHRF